MHQIKRSRFFSSVFSCPTVDNVDFFFLSFPHHYSNFCVVDWIFKKFFFWRICKDSYLYIFISSTHLRLFQIFTLKMIEDFGVNILGMVLVFWCRRKSSV